MQHLRIVIFKGSKMWIAQLLEHDICTQGRDIKSLLDNVYKKISIESKLRGESFFKVQQAPAQFTEMWEKRTPMLEFSNHQFNVEVGLCA